MEALYWKDRGEEWTTAIGTELGTKMLTDIFLHIFSNEKEFWKRVAANVSWGLANIPKYKLVKKMKESS
jgi:hypothetical protein